MADSALLGIYDTTSHRGDIEEARVATLAPLWCEKPVWMAAECEV